MGQEGKVFIFPFEKAGAFKIPFFFKGGDDFVTGD